MGELDGGYTCTWSGSLGSKTITVAPGNGSSIKCDTLFTAPGNPGDPDSYAAEKLDVRTNAGTSASPTNWCSMQIVGPQYYCSGSPAAPAVSQPVTWTVYEKSSPSYQPLPDGVSWTGTDSFSATTNPAQMFYSTSGIKNATASISDADGNPITNVSCSVAMGMPDLTAGNISPTSATASVPTTLSATVSNNGSGGTGAGFTDLFEINPGSIPPDFASIQTLRTYASAALAAGGSNTATASYTFPSAGDYYVRACADTNTSNVGSIPESNEDNNCSAIWTKVTVSGGSPSLSCSRAPSGSPLPRPATVTYTAVPANGAAAPYTFKNALGNTLQSGASLTYQTTYNSPGNYAVTVTAANVPSPVACGAALTVTGVSCGTLSNSITANPTRLPSPGTTDVTWTASNVTTSCVITKNGTTVATETANACRIPGNGGTLDNDLVSMQTTYCITCDGNIGARKCVTVNIGGNFQEF